MKAPLQAFFSGCLQLHLKKEIRAIIMEYARPPFCSRTALICRRLNEARLFGDDLKRPVNALYAKGQLLKELEGQFHVLIDIARDSSIEASSIQIQA
ncbi:MAG: hypothetical protein LBU32_21700 [Clostridiales bacterium]|nr:hypothetical protein [Clostridiales bacterium]